MTARPARVARRRHQTMWRSARWLTDGRSRAAAVRLCRARAITAWERRLPDVVKARILRPPRCGKAVLDRGARCLRRRSRPQGVAAPAPSRSRSLFGGQGSGLDRGARPQCRGTPDPRVALDGRPEGQAFASWRNCQASVGVCSASRGSRPASRRPPDPPSWPRRARGRRPASGAGSGDRFRSRRPWSGERAVEVGRRSRKKPQAARWAARKSRSTLAVSTPSSSRPSSATRSPRWSQMKLEP